MSRLLLTTCALCALLLIAGTIDLDQLDNYADQSIPAYISKDNTTDNPITDYGATLGRVLFYDKQLSSDNAIACASCHQQEHAFSTLDVVSTGVSGTTGRHSMRLVNARFGEEVAFFWDERAATLEEQVTMPIQDHIEMGWSGTLGDGDIDDLIVKLSQLDYYEPLFTHAFGDATITEARMQQALAQFVRSIQSFDSKYDVGRAQVNNNGQPFPNFTAEENAGKQLFGAPPQFVPDNLTLDNGQTIQVSRRTGGGLGCQGCHAAPEFDIDPNSLNNGIIESLIGTTPELNITRSPSLRDLLKADGTLNGGVFHTGLGSGDDLDVITDHYNLPSTDLAANPDLDPRLRPGGRVQFLDMTDTEVAQLHAFLRTLTGTNVYTDPKWSDPFDDMGNLTIIGSTVSVAEVPEATISVYPNPVSELLVVECELTDATIRLFDTQGRLLHTEQPMGYSTQIDVASLPAGQYLVQVVDAQGRMIGVKKVVKR